MTSVDTRQADHARTSLPRRSANSATVIALGGDVVVPLATAEMIGAANWFDLSHRTSVEA